MHRTQSFAFGEAVESPYYGAFSGESNFFERFYVLMVKEAALR